MLRCTENSGKLILTLLKCTIDTMLSHRRGQTVRSGARNMAHRIIQKCDEECNRLKLFHPVVHANARAAEYTGLSLRTITRIRKEGAQCKEGESLSSPGKKRPRSIEKKFHCSEEDRTAIRNIIYEFYLEKKAVLSGPKLLVAIREKIDFPWKLHSLHRLLRSMGFRFKKSNGIKRILVERPNLVALRIKYLKAVWHYRFQNRNIVYIDETWVDNTSCFSKWWHSEETLDVSTDTAPTQRLIIVHAGGRNGFIKDAELIFRAETTTGDFREHISAMNFEKWVCEQLIPNIPENSVIIMDNAPYHCIQLNTVPSKYGKKKEMVDWLVNNGIHHSETMNKYELYALIERHKKPGNVFRIDEILKLRGHNILRIPPYMYDLNPIKLAWQEVKRKIQEECPSTLSNVEFENLTHEAINGIKLNEWEHFCKHIEDIEKGYWEKDNLMENILDQLTILESSESESDSYDSSESEEL